jgi:hypothetical protein
MVDQVLKNRKPCTLKACSKHNMKNRKPCTLKACFL